MKTRLIAIGVAGLVLGLASSNGAQQSDRVYPIIELSDEDVAQIDIKDGSIEDWLDIVGEPTVTALNFWTTPIFGPYDPASTDFRIWLAWHAATNRIYMAMERADDVFVNSFARQARTQDNRDMGRQDYVLLGVDGDHSGGKFVFGSQYFPSTEEWMLQQDQQAQQYSILPEVDDGGSTLEMHGHLFFENYEDWLITPPYADGGGVTFGEKPTIVVTECYVTPFDKLVWNDPGESLVSELYPGKIIGFCIDVLDVDSAHSDPESIHYLRSSETGFTYSDTFVEGILLGPGGETPDDSAVESIPWGRLKAALRW